MAKERSIILIDGSNFYFKLRSLGLQNLLNLDFTGFLKKLAKESKIISTVYFIGAVKTDGSKRTMEMYKNQRRLLASLRKHNLHNPKSLI